MKTKPTTEALLALVDSDKIDNQIIDVWNAIAEIGSTELRLRDAVTNVADRTDRVLRSLDRGHRLNELGELQGSAFEVDRLCAERQLRIDFAKRLLRGATIDDDLVKADLLAFIEGAPGS